MAKEYTSIRVSESAKKWAADAKGENETWDEYIRRCSEHPPEVREFVERETPDPDPDFPEVPRAETVEQMHDAVQTVEQRTGRIERLLEDLQR